MGGKGGGLGLGPDDAADALILKDIKIIIGGEGVDTRCHLFPATSNALSGLMQSAPRNGRTQVME